MIIVVTGCTGKSKDSSSNENEEAKGHKEIVELAEKIYKEVYELGEEQSDVSSETQLDISLKVEFEKSCTKEIVQKFGEAGYVAIDSENRVDMSCPEKLKEFIDKQEKKETSQIKVIRVTYRKGFSICNE